MRGDADRLIEVATLLGQRLNGAVQDMIPPEAQTHLLNAQRELLTAVFLIYEHQVGARSHGPGPSAKGTRTSRTTRAPRRSRVQRIEIE